LDIRDATALASLVTDSQPEIVFHLAAQPLVRRSYREPIETWSTNVMGTAHLLEACRNTKSVKAIVIVTSDKCYANQEWQWGYREHDRLGGHDPYSASKAAAELVAASYRRSFFGGSNSPLLATARAGNVVGGGDWSEDRLIPDLVRAISAQQPLEIRSPNATRPWQHVLDSLSGYLMLGQQLLNRRCEFADAWNFGPEPAGNQTVSNVLEALNKFWPELRWHESNSPQPHEANFLYVDSAKANRVLNWQPIWRMEETLKATANWYRAWLETNSVVTRHQIDAYGDAAQNAGAIWTRE